MPKNSKIGSILPCQPLPRSVWVFPKKGGKKTKMDGEHFMENPMNKWMIWGGFSPLFLETPISSPESFMKEVPSE